MSAPSSRLASLDAFRGFAIAGMVLVNNPGSWAHVHGPLAHAEWHGCTFTDLIFPFFLFASGLSMTISLRHRGEGGRSRWLVYRGLARRAALLFLIGVGMALIPRFDFGSLRVLGVLQRIALALVLAAPVVLWGRWRAALAAVLGLSGVYLVLMLGVPVPGVDGVVAAGRLTPGNDFGAWLDRLVLGGHLWARVGTWDPEGLVGTLTATATLLLGVLAGQYLAAPLHPGRKAPRLLLAGAALVASGLWMGAAFIPVNKSLWTPSYVLLTGGWSLLFLGAFHGALDEAPEAFRAVARKAALPLSIYGLNALFLFVLSGLVARLIQLTPVTVAGTAMPLKAWLFQSLAALPLSPRNASLLFAVLYDLAMFGVAWVMWRKRWVVKV